MCWQFVVHRLVTACAGPMIFMFPRCGGCWPFGSCSVTSSENGAPQPTVNPRKLEHSFRRIHAAIPHTLL